VTCSDPQNIGISSITAGCLPRLTKLRIWGLGVQVPPGAPITQKVIANRCVTCATGTKRIRQGACPPIGLSIRTVGPVQGGERRRGIVEFGGIQGVGGVVLIGGINWVVGAVSIRWIHGISGIEAVCWVEGIVRRVGLCGVQRVIRGIVTGGVEDVVVALVLRIETFLSECGWAVQLRAGLGKPQLRQ
jgi:hypothetical protein